ncbi:hypothetical protein [Citrifermentans bremense]|uniref:hypothetical protein n=1 Tax=Citrifermentans bremense TaxID=60035 RepID=UPI0004232EBA|nr:hypothetical protein [Citrifermentans bremense]
MKKAALVVMAAFVMTNTSLALAIENMSKNECLTISKNCKDEVDSIQQQITKLNAEIKKGTKVYTPEELKALHQKLKDINATLKTLNKPGK